MDWVIEEFATLSLGDKRLNTRAQKVLAQLSHNSLDSIPTACRGAAETKAAYRLFNNQHVTPEKIYATHFEATLSRMAKQPVILIPQDTTILNFTTQYARKDTGPTNADCTKGMLLHCAIALTPEKTCLGVVSVHQWFRKSLHKLTRTERTKKNYAIPIEDKESYRWLQNYKRIHEISGMLPDSSVVCIADREGDIYDIYEEANKISSEHGNAHYLIRAQCDRKLCSEEGRITGHKIKEKLKQEQSLGQLTIHVSETKKRKARDAQMTVYSKALHIALPEKRKKGEDYKPVSVTAILCIEHNPPSGAEAIEWLLITDLSVSTFAQACEKIQWYTCRWQIEIFFKILKSGCVIEKLQLTNKNFSACLSFYMIIAWRILYMVILGRHCPNLSCEVVFSQEEWQTAYVVIRRQKPPSQPPMLNEMVRMVASLGGYMNRRSDRDPGVKTMWIGLRNLQEHIKAKEAFEAVYGSTCG